MVELGNSFQRVSFDAAIRSEQPRCVIEATISYRLRQSATHSECGMLAAAGYRTRLGKAVRLRVRVEPAAVDVALTARNKSKRRMLAEPG